MRRENTEEDSVSRITVKSMARGVAVLLAALLLGQVTWPWAVGMVSPGPGETRVLEHRVVRIGDTLPDLFVMPVVEPSLSEGDRSITLSAALARSSAGPCTFLIVYSTTCGACRRAAAAWARATTPVREGFDGAVLWLSLPDSPDRIQAFHQEFGLSAPAYLLASADQAGAMGVIGTPTVYAVDRSLRVVRMPGAAPEELVRGSGPEALAASCREQGA